MLTSQWAPYKEADGSTTWNYVGQNGSLLKKRWIEIDKKDKKYWVYLGENGTMLTNRWIKSVDGYTYYVGDDGVMVTDAWVGEYYVDEAGRWIEDKVKPATGSSTDKDDTNTNTDPEESGSDFQVGHEQLLREQLEQAKADAAAYKDITARQSLAFFEWLGWEDVEDFFYSPNHKVNGEPIYLYTDLGDPKDATHLENMRTALEWIEKCNKIYRKERNGLSELNVSSYMMLGSQLNTNWSANNKGHSGLFIGGENIAWGYTNPYDGWYDKEKEIYDSGADGVVGHYLNIIRPYWNITGFAVNQKSTVYRSCFGQLFNTCYLDADPIGQPVYTLEEYTAKFNEFMDYYKSIENSDQRVAELEKELEELLKQGK